MKISKYQKEILEILKEKDAYILVYQSRLDVCCVLVVPNSLRIDKVVRFDSFAKLVADGLIKQKSFFNDRTGGLSKKTFGDWEGRWVLK